MQPEPPAPEPSRAELFQKTSERALRLLTEGATEAAILTCLVGGAETAASAGAVSSILLLDHEGLLRNGASPNLPRDYLDAIDRIKPEPNVGTCAAVAATGEVVFTPDFYADAKWAELRHLPMQLGFAGAWSAPIFTPDGTIVGTFGTYFREKRLPSPEEIAGVKRLAEVAGMAIARSADGGRNSPTTPNTEHLPHSSEVVA